MTVVSAKSFPDPSTLPLLADVQYREPFATRAFNRKLRGIVPMGIYQGLLPTPGVGLNVVVTSAAATGSVGAASFDVAELYQVTVLQQTDVNVSIAAGTAKVVVLQAVYEKGLETYQVNSKSTIQAVEILLVDVGTALAANQLELATVTVPTGTTQITEAMIDLSGRKMQMIGVELSSEIDSAAENVAANSLAVKNAIAHLRDSAPAVLNTIGLLAKALNSDPDFYETVNSALDKKMSIAENGADIADVPTFLKNLGLPESVTTKALVASETAALGATTTDSLVDTITNIGKQVLYKVKVTTLAQLYALPVGATIMLNSVDTLAGISPVSNKIGYLKVIGRRDVLNGAAFLWSSYDSTQIYYGYSGSSDELPTWVKLSSLSDYTSLFSTAGYQKLPSGLILQWMTVTHEQTTDGLPLSKTNSWPIAFPNACLSIQAVLTGSVIYVTTTGYPFAFARLLSASQFYSASSYNKSSSTVTIWGIGY